jgi:hypothetical protein
MKPVNAFNSAAAFFLLLAACISAPGDVLIKGDGSILSGELETIEPGRVVFSNGSAEVSDQARVWLIDGTTFAGGITASDGVVRSSSSSVSMDSVYLVVWGNTDISQESFTIDAGTGWLNTGIELEPGDMLSIRGEGTVVTETGVSTPEGQNEYSSSVSLVPGATSGQLVFQVGEFAEPVAAGILWVGESPGEGTLRLAVNAPLEGSMKSRGVYTVTVNAGTNGRSPGTVAFYPASR